MTNFTEHVRPMDQEHYALIAPVEQKHWWYAARRTIIRSIVEELYPNGCTIADIGCGNGGNTACFQSPFHATGIDISQAAIDSAQTLHPHAHFVVGKAEDHRELIGKADIVLLMDTLEHIHDDAEFLRSIVSMMRSGATLLITVPANPALWSAYDIASGHHRRYTTQSLHALFTALPVDISLLAGLNTRLAVPLRMVRALQTKKNTDIKIIGDTMKIPFAPLNKMLRIIFSGERHRLLRKLRRHHREQNTKGISLIAAVRKCG